MLVARLTKYKWQHVGESTGLNLAVEAGVNIVEF